MKLSPTFITPKAFFLTGSSSRDKNVPVFLPARYEEEEEEEEKEAAFPPALP